jgi:hypothetical protein
MKDEVRIRITCAFPGETRKSGERERIAEKESGNVSVTFMIHDSWITCEFNGFGHTQRHGGLQYVLGFEEESPLPLRQLTK